MRKLAIPVVMDRVVGQSINLVFAEIFDPDFTESNFDKLVKSLSTCHCEEQSGCEA